MGLIRCLQSMIIKGRLDRKKNDFVKYAFILQEKGDLSIDQLQFYIKNAFPAVDCCRSRIASICGRKSIFSTNYHTNKLKTHTFEGQIPIDPRIKEVWRERLSLKG